MSKYGRRPRLPNLQWNRTEMDEWNQLESTIRADHAKVGGS